MSSNTSKLLYQSDNKSALHTDSFSFISGNFIKDIFKETKSLAFTFLLDILPTILSIS